MRVDPAHAFRYLAFILVVIVIVGQFVGDQSSYVWGVAVGVGVALPAVARR